MHMLPFLAFFSNVFTGGDGIIILIIVLVIFGPKKLPELARGMGQAIKEFHKAKDEIERELTKTPEVAVQPAPGQQPRQPAELPMAPLPVAAAPPAYSAPPAYAAPQPVPVAPAAPVVPVAPPAPSTDFGAGAAYAGQPGQPGQAQPVPPVEQTHPAGQA